MIRPLFAEFVSVLISIPVYGGVITTQTFNFADTNGVVQATVTVTVLDNYHGDPTKQDWIYTINNLSFTTVPAPGAPTVGLSAFGSGGFANNSMLSVYDVTGVYEPGNNPLMMNDISPGFCVPCDLFGGWVLPDSRGTGVLPGQSTTVDYSWLNVPGAVTNPITARAYLGIINYYFGYVSGDLSGSVLIPRTTVPEPATYGLVACAVCVWGLFRRRQKPSQNTCAQIPRS